MISDQLIDALNIFTYAVEMVQVVESDLKYLKKGGILNVDVFEGALDALEELFKELDKLDNLTGE